jgi:ABC-type nitrate/sulfonate/bicarbonate transport system substrate-binding protein
VVGVRQTSVPDSAKDRIKAIADENNSGVPFIGGALFVRQDFLNTNKPALTRFLAALGKGADWVRAHPDEAIPACQDTGSKAEDCKTNIAADIAAKDGYTWSSTTRVDADGIKAMVALYATPIPQFKTMTLTDFVDTSVAASP